MSEPFSPARSLGDDDSGSELSAFLPLLILGLVMLAWFGFQVSQLRTERDAMREVITNQQKQVDDSKKLRDALDAVARGTAQLAAAGNPNAKLIVDELKRRGVTITPNQPPAPTAPSPASK
jgi:hypothetical protein